MHKLVYTIREVDVGQSHAKTNDGVVIWFFDRAQPHDVGKRIYDVNGVQQMENDDQLKARLAKTGGSVVEVPELVRQIGLLMDEVLKKENSIATAFGVKLDPSPEQLRELKSSLYGFFITAAQRSGVVIK